ncbi:MAG: DUF5695 domain-containing protein, partial [Planctomycetota bacterium]
MIGLLTIRASPDPDGQHGERLQRWLEKNGHGRLDVLDIDALVDGDLNRYEGLWWHLAVGNVLPSGAVDPESLTVLKRYVTQGGKLFLSRSACLLVEPLGVAEAPRVRFDAPPRYFLRPGVRIEDTLHPLTRGLRRRLVMYNHLDIEQFSELAWLRKACANATPLGSRMMNGAVFRDQLNFLEWRTAKGCILAFGGAGLHIHEKNDLYRADLIRFVAASLAYLENPCLLGVRAESGTIVPALYEDSYVRAMLGPHDLAFERPEPALLRFLLTPFQIKNPSLQVRLEKEGRLCSAAGLDLEQGEGPDLSGVMRIDTAEWEEGLYTLHARVRAGKEECLEESIPLLLKGKAGRTVRLDKKLSALSKGRIMIEVDNGSGCAKGLFSTDHPLGLNFLANETNSILGEADPAPWFGTIQGRFRGSGETAWRDFSNRGPRPLLENLSDERIRFRSPGPAGPLAIAWEYQCLPDRIRWTFSLENQSDSSLEIGALILPVSLNTFFGIDTEQQVIYEKRVMMHNLICRRGSYLFAEPLAGIPPFLLILPRFDEGFECAWHDSGVLKGNQPAWEGLLHAGIFTRAEQEEQAFAPWFLGHTAL